MTKLNWSAKFSYSIFLLCLADAIFWASAIQGHGLEDCGSEQRTYLATQSSSISCVLDKEEHAVERSAVEPVEVVEPVQQDGGDDREDWSSLTFALCMGGLASFVILLLYPLSRSAKAKKAAELLLHPSELLLLLKFKFIYSHSQNLTLPTDLTPSSRYCYEKLKHVSRSFAVVILELPAELREAICIFYLVLRALDTVEDDMAVPVEGKIAELKVFHQHLEEPGWTLSGYGEVPAERDLLEQFHHVQTVFKTLPPRHQSIITDITQRMGAGMAEFAERTVETVKDYNLYCHYVAGLVGIGLSQMFSASGLEEEELGKQEDVSNSMGLFLQKTNITRDYYEDITAVNSRMFYPKEIWGKYARALPDLMRPDHATKAVHCLNEMVTDATAHIPHCIKYLQAIKNQAIFKFCAIPQAMAIATMAKLYNNHAVFSREVKIRKGEAVAIIMNCSDVKAVCSMFSHYIRDIQRRINSSDPNAAVLRARLREATELLQAAN